MPSRDSVVWWLVLAGSVLAYLANSPAPVTWSWAQWMQALAALVGIVAGYLRSSPLPGNKPSEPDGPMTPPRMAVLLLVGLALGSIACGPRVPIPVVPAAPLSNLAALAQRAEQAGKVVVEAQSAEIGMHELGWISRDQHVTVQRSILVLATSVDELLSAASTTTTQQTAAAALAKVAAALTRFELDVQAVPNASVRGVLSAIARVVRLTVSVLPDAMPGPVVYTADVGDVLERWAPITYATMGGAR